MALCSVRRFAQLVIDPFRDVEETRTWRWKPNQSSAEFKHGWSYTSASPPSPQCASNGILQDDFYIYR